MQLRRRCADKKLQPTKQEITHKMSVCWTLNSKIWSLECIDIGEVNVLHTAIRMMNFNFSYLSRCNQCVSIADTLSTHPSITNSPYFTFGLSARPSASGSTKIGDSMPSVLQMKKKERKKNRLLFYFKLTHMINTMQIANKWLFASVAKA